MCSRPFLIRTLSRGRDHAGETRARDDHACHGHRFTEPGSAGTRIGAVDDPGGPGWRTSRAGWSRGVTRRVVGVADVDEQRHHPGGDDDMGPAGDRRRVHQECDQRRRRPGRCEVHRHVSGGGHDVLLPGAGAERGRLLAVVERCVGSLPDGAGRAGWSRGVTRRVVGVADVAEQRHHPGGDDDMGPAGDRRRVHQECDQRRRRPGRREAMPMRPWWRARRTTTGCWRRTWPATRRGRTLCRFLT